MKKGLILFADGFEDSEGIVTRDVLMRGGLTVVSASISSSLSVLTSHKLKIETDVLLSKTNLKDFDFLILPGGLLGVQNLSNSFLVIDAIHYFLKNKKDVYAICAAPSILGKLGYLDNKSFTCFPGFEKGINGTYTGEEVCITSEHIITARSMAYSYDFAISILNKNADKFHIDKVIQGTKGLKNN